MLMYWSSRWNVSGLRETRVGPAFSSSYISTLLDASGGFRTLGVLLGEGDVDSVIRRVRSAAITSYRAVSLAVVVVCCGKLLSAYRHGAIMEKNRKLKWEQGDDNDPPQVSSNRPNNFDLIPTLPLGYKRTLISTRDFKASNL
ncbi:uncharacterized protein LOC123471463 isoform X1 [Daphnia magna]|uniref:uncharacterized protein LOC116920361 isoform X1 n=1 Tax=Daphnia magna TaxID=35525 RepID=UPI001E1BCF55|nr:uncharacterized protein LOC116920361 isoform X1 [Daphnia magna]XP_045028744.1 uncharacterized protein LOC123471463 isoform X1 [Daphnia magna]